MFHTDVGVVDLFCGVGGLAHGLYRSGLNILCGIDADETCRFPFEENNKSRFFQMDLTNPDFEMINEQFRDVKIKVLVGCAPCQPFSTYSYKSNNQKWNLLYNFLEVIKYVNPDIVSMENVPRIIKFNESQLYADFKSGLIEMGYNLSENVVFCPDYGIPQKRTRFVMLASKLGDISLIPKTHRPSDYVTVREAISHLPAIKAGVSNVHDFIHRSPKLSDLNLKRIQNTAEGGGWKDWTEELKLNCHLKDSGKGYRGVYGRMRWDEPAPTMTTFCCGYGNGRFGHPEQDRAISLREAALIQTFPESYVFFRNPESFNFKKGMTYVGNAVPVRLAEVIGLSIIKHLEKWSA